ELPLEPGDHPRVRAAAVCEDDENGVPCRRRLVEVVDEPEDALDPRVDDEGIEAIDHEGSGPALVEERGRRGPEVLEPPRVRGAHSAASVVTRIRSPPSGGADKARAVIQR